MKKIYVVVPLLMISTWTFGQMDSLSTTFSLFNFSQQPIPWTGNTLQANIFSATWRTVHIEIEGDTFHLNPHGNVLYLSNEQGEITAYKKGKRILSGGKEYLLKHGKLYTPTGDLLARRNYNINFSSAEVQVIAEKGLENVLWAFVLADGIWKARNELEAF